jgi:iron complex outermembrane receptor protein
MKYKDLQVSAIETQPNGQQQLVTSNAARASINGLEAEVSWRLTRADRLTGNASVLDAQYDDFLTCDSALLDCGVATNIVNLRGNKLPHAPKFSMTFAYEHDFALGSGGLVTPRAQVHYQTDSYLSPFNRAPSSAQVAGSFPEARTQKAYTTVDLSLRYQSPKNVWYAEAFVQNATDKAVKTDATWAAGAGGGAVWTSFYNAPRTFGARMNYRF